MELTTNYMNSMEFIYSYMHLQLICTYIISMLSPEEKCICHNVSHETWFCMCWMNHRLESISMGAVRQIFFLTVFKCWCHEAQVYINIISHFCFIFPVLLPRDCWIVFASHATLWKMIARILMPVSVPWTNISCYSVKVR